MQPVDVNKRKSYEQPLLRTLTSNQATLFLVGHAYIGHRGARHLLELMFPTQEDLNEEGVSDITASLGGESRLFHGRI